MNTSTPQPGAKQPGLSLDPKEELALRVRTAERAHDTTTDFGAKANEGAVKAAEEAIKAVILINGGSAVAMLAFIGTVASKDLLSGAQLAQISRPLLWFGFGVASAVVGSAMAYFTNLMIAESYGRMERSYQVPFVRDTALSKRHRLLGEIFRYIGVVAVTASIGCFIVGLIKAESAFAVMTVTTSVPTAD
jgi:hypothetical protein